MDSEANWPEPLAVMECAQLLRRHSRGRVALSVDALPSILPVNYGVLGDQIMLSAGRDPKLSSAMRNAVIALEVDEVDPVTGRGWSVLVRGVARDADRRTVVEAWPSTKPWFDDDQLPVMALSAHLISGRPLPSWGVGDGR